MRIIISELNSDREKSYEELLAEAPMSMLYHSLKYRNFLADILEGAYARYLLAYDGGVLVAALPAFIKKGPYGTVVNSLPFYGSHGSIIFRKGSGREPKRLLLDAFEELCQEEKAVSATIISNPLGCDLDLFYACRASLVDERIGQFTHLPKVSGRSEVSTALMDSFHHKTRNMIRKGNKAGFICSHNGGVHVLKCLYDIHVANMRESAKPWSVFEAINKNFDYEDDYRVYCASKDGKVVSAMLLFYYKDAVEYFIPATYGQYRSDQPLSFLIFKAMQDAVLEKKCSLWNWGGTWLTQEGVYRFKSRWGTEDASYWYNLKFYPGIEKIKSSNQLELLSHYPYFYLFPFSKINRN